MSRCPVCPAPRFGVEGGPTIALSRAAERTTIKRHGHVKENMFVNRRWRRRLQRHVGPGHGGRRAFRSPDHDHGRDSEVADTGRKRTRRDPATDRTARDAHSPRHVRRRALPHATSPRGCDPATDDSARDEPYRTRRAMPHAIRHQTIPHTTILILPPSIWLLGYVRICPDMSRDTQ